MAGCSGNKNTVIKSEQSTRLDVFQEVADSKPISGKALLGIEFTVKTYKSRIANTYIKHSDPLYTVTINIDGQSIVLADEPVLEDLSGDFRSNPEVGTGWKYNFRKELQLKPGKHRVTIAVPLSGVVVEKELMLEEGKNHLKLVPVYNTSINRDPNYPKYIHGLKAVTLQLNSKSVAK